MLEARLEILLLQREHSSLPYLIACSSSVLLPAGLAAWLLVGSASPSAPLQPAPSAAASSCSAPGCEQTEQERSEEPAGCRQVEDNGKKGQGVQHKKALSCQQTKQGLWKHSTASRGQDLHPFTPTQERNREYL